tara:strand:- start:1346 stop:1831 length:486 start_codon:yes stop_codon:yes gene_type:complete
MAFDGSSYLCTSFKVGLLNGDFDFSGNTSQSFKIALYTNSAAGTNFGGDGTAMDGSVLYYATNNQVANGNGYTTGGGGLTISTAPTDGGSGTVAYLSFANETWTSATFTARGAIIYRSDGSAPTNDAVAVIDFTADKTATNGDFTVQFPTANNSAAIIRIA